MHTIKDGQIVDKIEAKAFCIALVNIVANNSTRLWYINACHSNERYTSLCRRHCCIRL